MRTKYIVLIAAGLSIAGLAFWFSHLRRGVNLFAQNRNVALAKFNRHRLSNRFDQAQQEQDFFILKRVPGGQGPLDRSLYQAAYGQMQSMQQISIPTGAISPAGTPMTGSGMAPLSGWTFLGPGNIGGRTRAIVIDPTNTQIMYTAAVAGGVWKTTNGGATWSPSSDFLANIAVNSLIMDPNNNLILYAGTGEGYFNVDGVRGNGIYKTTDGGATWTQLASTNNNSDFYYVNKLEINAASTRVYAATRTGVFRSLDGGSTWSKVLDGTAVNGCMDVKVQKKPLAYVFAACGTLLANGSTTGFIARAIDNSGTENWSTVFNPTNMGRTSLAIAPSNQNVIYALTASNETGNYNQGLLAVYRSMSQGTSGTWTTQVSNTNGALLNTLLLTNPIIAEQTQCGFGASSFNNQGWYDNIIAVDPSNPNTVWVGGIELFRSTDGGQSWGQAAYWWAGPSFSVYDHADHHALVFDPGYNGTTNQILWETNDGGIFKTSNAVSGNVATTQAEVCGTLASNPVAWTNLNNSYGVTQFYYGTPYPGGATFVGGTQDNGTNLGTTGGGANAWTTVLGGDGGAVAVNPSNTNMAWGENYGLSIKRTVNAWSSLSAFTSGISEASGNFLFITPFVQDPSDAANMWTGGARIWRTTQATANPTSGNIWTQASAFLGERVSSLAVAPTNSNIVYVGGQTGDVWYNTSALSATSATVWSSTRPAGASSCFISGVAVDPTNASNAWAVSSTFGIPGCMPHVWYTTNGGSTWTPMGGTGSNIVPDISVHTVAVNPTNPLKVYIGTDLGMMVTTDGGTNWMVANATPFPNGIVDNIVAQNNSGTVTLFVFTHGRSAWSVTAN